MKPLLISQNLPASREVLWRYVSTAQGLASWQADSVQGGLEEGGFQFRWPELGARMDLDVEELETNQHLTLRSGDSRLRMEVGEGRISISHGGLQAEDDLEGLESSWRTALSLLQIATGHHVDQSRSVSWLFRPIVGSAELAHYYFTDPAGLATWLGTSDTALLEQSPFELQLGGNDRLSGQVLCAHRDVCLRVEQINHGALVLRTLPGPDDKRIAAAGISVWGGTPKKDFLGLVETALGRLSRLVQTPAN